MLENVPISAQIIISVAAMLVSGYFFTKITKIFRLPDVTAYILAGILLGPYIFDVVPVKISDGMGFLSDIALAFIAFGTGEFFKMKSLKRNGVKTLVITVFESLTATAVTFIVMYPILGLPFEFCLVLSTLAAATAPASTVMTIRQTGAKGDFVETVLEVVALDDAVGIIMFSAAISVAGASVLSASVSTKTVIMPMIFNIVSVVVGCIFGFLMKILISNRSNDNRLIIAVAIVFSFCGICTVMETSPLLGCMAMGTVYTNISEDDKLFRQLNYFTPPIFLLFFVRSGLNFKLDTLFDDTSSINGFPLIWVGIIYFFVRIAGKYFGAYFGCVVTKKNKLVKRYLGFALVPQAGVAIGLAAFASRIIGGETGSDIETVILASSVLYELVGPALAKMSLYLSHSYSPCIDNVVPDEMVKDIEKKNDVEILIDKIKIIQSDIKKDNDSDDEKAFDEAAEEFYILNSRKRKFRR